MSWAGGSQIIEDVAKAIMKYVPREHKQKVASKLIDIFESNDCDTIGEVEQKDIEKEYLRRNPQE